MFSLSKLLLICICAASSVAPTSSSLIDDRELPFGGGGGGGGSPPPNIVNATIFKLFWQLGYTWQEETIERKWCIRCTDGTCEAGERLFLTGCDDQDQFPTQFLIRSAVPMLPLDVVVIEAAGTNLCWEAIPEQDVIFLDTCTLTRTNQWFYADIEPDGKFEIRPFIEPEECLTQLHHPKFGEEIIIQFCSVARIDETSYWIPYQVPGSTDVNTNTTDTTPSTNATDDTDGTDEDEQGGLLSWLLDLLDSFL